MASKKLHDEEAEAEDEEDEDDNEDDEDLNVFDQFDKSQAQGADEMLANFKMRMGALRQSKLTVKYLLFYD